MRGTYPPIISSTVTKAVSKIAKELNIENTPTKNRLKGGWNVSTISRILKDKKYIGKYTWNKTKSVKDPLTGKTKQIPRPKQEWTIRDQPDMPIIKNDTWEKAQKRWHEIENTYPTMKGKKGFKGQQKSYVSTHPPHLLSGCLKCGECGGSISLVSGKGSGYYGCINASRRPCKNKMLISRKPIRR